MTEMEIINQKKADLTIKHKNVSVKQDFVIHMLGYHVSVVSIRITLIN